MLLDLYKMKYLSDIIDNLNSKIVDDLWRRYQLKKYLKASRRELLLKSVLEKKAFLPASSSSFSHLKKKLKSDLYNTILSQPEGSIYKTHFAEVELKVKKALLVIEILYSKGAYLEAEKSLFEHLKIAKHYELFDQQLQFLEFIIDMKVFAEKGFDLEAHYKKQMAVRELQEKFLSSKKLYYLALKEVHFKDSVSSKRIKRYLFELKNLFEQTASVRIGFNYRLVELSFYNNNKQYKEALETANELKGLIYSSKILSSNANKSRVYSEIARLQMIFQDFEQSKKNTLDSLKYANKKSQSGLMSVEAMFKLSLFTNDLTASATYLYEGLKHKMVKKDVSYRAKWSYYEACQLFAEKKFTAANNVLRLYLEKHGVAFDKKGWAFGVRLLHLMLLINLKDFDKAALEIRNLHYQLKTVKKLPKRSELIIGVLDCAKKEHFEFKKSDGLGQCFLELQKEKWDPLSFELINFTEWLEAKIQ